MPELVKTFQNIFDKVQFTSSAHQKYVNILFQLYKTTPPQEFFNTFQRIFELIMRQSTENRVFTKKVLQFTSKFCAAVTQREEQEHDSHDFLTQVMELTLQWASLDEYNLRYNSCCFIAIVLQDIGENVQLEIFLIDEVQKALLEIMQENNVAIRLEAMSALVRLQEPENDKCPVVLAFHQALDSPSSNIRREALKNIAPNLTTLPKIKEKVQDVDPSVRAAAYRKCADVGPYNFKIIDKNKILMCGFKEDADAPKTVFHEYFLPKWLTAYKGNYLEFVKALKLIADEDDMDNMKQICTLLVEEFYKKYPIDDIIGTLPIEDKLIKIGNLRNEVSLFWNILVKILRDFDELEGQLSRILPEMTPFCHYIESVITAKFSEKMDEWKNLECQFDLLNLFEIAEGFDFSDEVGRRTMLCLITTILKKYSFTRKLLKKLILIAQKCSTNIDFFINDICQLISDIKEPEIVSAEPLSGDQIREREFQIASLKVNINILSEQQDEALKVRDYQSAQVFQLEIVADRKKLEILLDEPQASVSKRSTIPETEKICLSLDLLIGILELPEVLTLTPSLITYRDQFVVPMITNENSEIHWRILRCLSLMSVIDKPTAEEYAKVISIPIATYRLVHTHNVRALIESICGVADLICFYGIEIISNTDTANNTTQNTKRKLYNNDNGNGTANDINDNMSVPLILEYFLDMLDDEREEIRLKAVDAIASFVNMMTPVTPSVLSRIILKWCSPLTEKHDHKVQGSLGISIEKYVHFKNCGDVVKEAVLLTISSVADAPRSSPLADIGLENLLTFLGEISNMVLQRDSLKILCLDIFMKIEGKPTSRIVALLGKLLCHLDMGQDNAKAIAEVLARGEMVLEVVKDRLSRRYIEKFLGKIQSSINIAEQTNETNHSTNTQESQDTLQQSNEEEATITKSAQTKRKKKSSGLQNCRVVLQNLMANKDKNNLSPASTLQTIVESKMENMELDDNLSIEAPSTKSSNNSSQNRSNVIVVETSDSEEWGASAEVQENK